MKKIILLFVILFSSSASATVYFDQTLNFGTFSIADNNSVSTIVVPANGNSYSTNTIHIIYPGHPAIIRFTNFTPYTTLFLTAITPVQTAVPSGTTEQFTLTQVDMPTSLETDISGNANMRLGGTLQSSGNGGGYIDTNYQATLTLMISY